MKDRYENSTLDNFITTKNTESILRQLREYAVEFGENYRKGVNLILSGRVGCGKTHLAFALKKQISKEYIEIEKEYRSRIGKTSEFETIFIKEKQHAVTCYTTSSFLLDFAIAEQKGDVSYTYDKGGKRFSNCEKDSIYQAHFAIIDELGMKKYTEWEKEILYNFIDHRCRYQLPTMYISNWSKSSKDQPELKFDLKYIMGERNFDRIFNKDSKYFYINEKSRR